MNNHVPCESSLHANSYCSQNTTYSAVEPSVVGTLTASIFGIGNFAQIPIDEDSTASGIGVPGIGCYEDIARADVTMKDTKSVSVLVS
jgi:hypothetical protein